MVDFSIQALTAPFVPPTNRYFTKITENILKKHPTAQGTAIDHDLKVIMFNAASLLIVATVALAYFKMLSLVTAVALTVLFYFTRRIIAETIGPVEIPKEKPDLLEEIKKFTAALLSNGRTPDPGSSPPKSIKEKVEEIFYQGDDIVIGPVILVKMTHLPWPKTIGMIFTRSP